MGLVATGVFRQVAAEFSPVITAISVSVEELGVSIGQINMREQVDTAAQFTGMLIDALEVCTVLGRTLTNIVQLDFSGAGDSIKSAFDFSTGDKLQQKIIEAREAAAKAAKEERAKDKSTGPDFEASAASNAGQKDNIADRIQSLNEEISLIGKTKDEVDRLKFARMGATAEQLKEFELLQQSRNEAEELAKQTQRGKQIEEQLMTPVEKLAGELAELDDLALNGAISAETYNAAIANLAKRGGELLDKDVKEPPKIGMLQKGSVEAYSAGLANERNAKGQEGKTLQEIKTILERIANHNPQMIGKV
jgi:hypothetical protein